MKVKNRLLWLLLHLLALAPLALLVWDYTHNNLGFDPIREATLRSGKTAITFLILSLAVTPAGTIFGWPWLRPFRRFLGLYAFMYAAAHFLIFIWVDYGFNWGLIREAMLEKRFALAGLAAFLLMVPLAVTSTVGWVKRLGGRRWRRLHQLVYLSALLAVLHYIWLVKADIRVPLTYGALVVVLLALRLPFVRRGIRRLTGRDARRAAGEETLPPG